MKFIQVCKTGLFVAAMWLTNASFAQTVTLTYADFLADSDWEVPAGVTLVTVQVWGSGGGGGGGHNDDDDDGGGGGGGGGYSTTAGLVVVPGADVAFVIGQGGGGGAVNSNGTAGATSSILGVTAGGGGFGLRGDTGSRGGGAAGAGNDQNGGAGGTGGNNKKGGGGGQGACTGSDGEAGQVGNDGGDGGDTGGCEGGDGGDRSNGVGGAGAGIAGGGAGGTGDFSGGDGTDGQIIITYTVAALTCDPCYSVATGNWSDATTWSDAPSPGGTGGYTPTANGLIGNPSYIIEAGFTVTVDENINVDSVTVGNTGNGILSWGGDFAMNINNDGQGVASVISIASGSSIQRNGNNCTINIGSDNDGAETYTITSSDATTGLDATKLTVTGNSATVNLSGAGDVTLADGIELIGSGVTFNNSITGTFNIANDIEFADAVTGSTPTIWSEDFESYAHRAAVAVDNNTANAAVDWTVTASGSLGDALDVNDNTWENPLNGNKDMAAWDTDFATAQWLSEEITITGYTNVTVSALIGEDGQNKEDADFIDVDYQLNGDGIWLQVTGGYIINDFNDQTVTEAGLTGTTIQIRVIMYNDHADELHQLDDVLVVGTIAGSGGTSAFNNASGSTITFTGGDGDIQYIGGAGNVFSNSGTLAVLDDIIFQTGSYTSGFVTVNGSVTSAEDIVFVNENAAHNNYITNAGDLIISDSISVNQSSITFTNASTGTLDFVEYYGGDRNTHVIDNSGTITQTGTFTGILASQSTFTNLESSRWDYAGDNHDRDVRLFLAASQNTFNYNRNGSNQEIIRPQADDYYHLEITETNTKTPHVDDGAWVIDVQGNLLISGTSTLDVSARSNNITLAGNWSNYSTVGFTEGDETVDFDGGVPQAITNNAGTENFYNIKFTNTETTTINDHLDIANNIDIEGSAVAAPIASQNINVGGNWANYATVGFTEGSTGYVEFDGGAGQAITNTAGTENFYDVKFTNTGTTTQNPHLDIANDLTISGTATLAPVAAKDIDIAGNWLNSSSGGFTEGTSTVDFDGATAQSITCSSIGTETFHNLIVSKSAGGSDALRTLTMNDHIALTSTGIVTFNGNGYIDINSKNFTVTDWTAGDIASYDSDKFFVVDQTGFIKYTGVGAGEVLNIPMGLATTAANYALADLTMTDAGSGTLDANLCGQIAKTGETCGGTPETDSVVTYTWNLVSTSTSAAIKLYWDTDAELTNFSWMLCSVTHHTGTKWENLNPSMGPATSEGGSLYSRTGLTTGFSPFGVQMDGSPLPIELLTFTASPENGNVRLDWITASEINNDYFTLEKGTDGKNFKVIAIVPGAGNSFIPLSYSAVDNAPYKGNNYYRLRQTDYDGTETVSSIITINLSEENTHSDNGFVKAKVFPNPMTGSSFYLSVENEENEKQVLVILYNQMGQEVYSKVIIIAENGSTITAIDTREKLQKGLYIITGSSDQHLFTKKLIVK